MPGFILKEEKHENAGKLFSERVYAAEHDDPQTA